MVNSAEVTANGVPGRIADAASFLWCSSAKVSTRPAA